MIRELMIGANRYVRGEGALKEIGARVRLLGRRALVVGGARALAAAGPELRRSLAAAGVDCEEAQFTADVSETQAALFASRARGFGADLVIGVGGGKAIDVSKWAADRVGLPFVSVPTSAATCASFVSLYITYTDDGGPVGGSYARQSPELVVVDSRVIAEAPARLLASGIGDTMSKWPETLYGANRIRRTTLIDATVSWGRLAFEICLEKGPAAVAAVRRRAVCAELEDVIDANLILSGVTGNTAGHEVRLAVAHCVHDGLITLDRRKAEKFLHGERVAYGTLVQMALSDGLGEDALLKTMKFMKSIGLPVSAKDLGFDGDASALDSIAAASRRERLLSGPAETSLESLRAALATVEDMAAEIA